MQLNFNASQVSPQTTPEPVDTAWYPVVITSAEEKPNSKNTGSYLELGFTIQGGQYANRVIKGRLNLKHPNPQTVEIAQGELSAICHVTGRMQLQHAQQLLGAPLQVYAIKAPRNDRPGQFSNDIQGYRDMNGNEPGQGAQHGGFAGGAQQQQTQGQNFGGNPQGGNPQGGWQGNNGGGGFDPNQQGGNGGYQQQNTQGFDPNAGQNNGNFQQGNQQGGYQQNPQGGYQQQQQGGNPNGGYQQQSSNQQGGGQNFGNNGGNQQGAGGPAGGGNMPSWA